MKEQAVGTLWNMSFDEKFRLRIANSDSFPLLVKFLEDDNLKVKEAAVGVLANLALSQSNHKIMVEAGVIPKLVSLTGLVLSATKLITSSFSCAWVTTAKGSGDEYIYVYLSLRSSFFFLSRN